VRARDSIGYRCGLGRTRATGNLRGAGLGWGRKGVVRHRRGVSSDGDALEVAEDLGLVVQEAAPVADDAKRDGVEVANLIVAELVELFSKALHEARLLLAREVVRLAEVEEDLVICRWEKRARQRNRGEGASLALARLRGPGEPLTSGDHRLEVLVPARLPVGAVLPLKLRRADLYVGVDLTTVRQRLQPSPDEVLELRVEPVRPETVERALVRREGRAGLCPSRFGLARVSTRSGRAGRKRRVLLQRVALAPWVPLPACPLAARLIYAWVGRPARPRRRAARRCLPGYRC